MEFGKGSGKMGKIHTVGSVDILGLGPSEEEKSSLRRPSGKHRGNASLHLVQCCALQMILKVRNFYRLPRGQKQPLFSI